MKYRVISEKPVVISVLQGSKLESCRFNPDETFLAAPKHAQKLLDAGEIELCREVKKVSTQTQAKPNKEVKKESPE